MTTKKIALVFPHQLFEKPLWEGNVEMVYLIEDFLFFRIQEFHPQRTLFLQGALKEYQKELSKSYRTHYLDTKKMTKRGAWQTHLPKDVEEVHVSDPVDHYLFLDLCRAAKKGNWELIVHETPQFLNTRNDVEHYFSDKKKLMMADFYKKMRHRYDILLNAGKPEGGKYSLDEENRERLPKEIKIPKVKVEKGKCLYPTNRKDAKSWLKLFLKERFKDFGPYEDAIAQNESFLFHSVLSPFLNVGLFTPIDVLDAALETKGIPLNSMEGFVRQLIGWREFMRGSYETLGVSMRTKNFFKHKKRMPKALWQGTTGIEPIDQTISKVLKTGYAHHIERLMILGNFMLLCEIDPDEVYDWFMALFIDAYDWVMVPNVYAMSQFADGGQIVTKPYVSGSSYILKMSDYKKGEWCLIWDGLFWRFLKKHSKLFGSNPRTKALLSNLERNKKTINEKIALAEQFLKDLK
jgi:deoxyribodipyrimidine photolyase-related protein